MEFVFFTYPKYCCTKPLQYTKFQDKALQYGLIKYIIDQQEKRDAFGCIIQYKRGHYEVTLNGKQYAEQYPYRCNNLPSFQ